MVPREGVATVEGSVLTEKPPVLDEKQALNARTSSVT